MSADQLNVNLDKVDSQMGELLSYVPPSLTTVTNPVLPTNPKTLIQ